MEILFFIFSFIMILSSIGVITSSNPVYAVLWLIFTFLNSSAIFIMLGAEFIAMTIVIVYVGAVAVLFLFVVMMLNINQEKIKKSIMANRFISLILFFVLLADFFLIINLSFAESYQIYGSDSMVNNTVSNTHAIGLVLYTDYFLHFQLCGLVLLLAMVGCITLTLRTRDGVKKQDASIQLDRSPEDCIKLVKVKAKAGVDGINY
jgi:NADH-quinone oxidoreductase subunit J